MSASSPLVLVFDTNNRLAVSVGSDGLAPADASRFASLTGGNDGFEFTHDGEGLDVRFAQAGSGDRPAGVEFKSIEQLESLPCSPLLAALLPALEPHLIAIPYLHLGPNDFIYKFRPEKERNPAIYAGHAESAALYQSQLCAAIKALARRHERSAAEPVPLDFGAVRYLLPSHFGFCLGVKNAIERAYETLAANPGRRVFMLSELIHNPFVNDDLLQRGLRYLQSDKGVPYAVSGATATEADGEPLLWDTLTPDDIVIIPAFGATDEDKRRLVRKGLAVCAHDATCMLVEKVWKAARAYGRDGYTVVIHGKAEHEETKATFSNTRRHAPAVIVRNLAEVRRLGEIIASDDPRVRARFFDFFAGRHTPGFDVDRHLERVAVVNQTTLLMNETREITEHLRQVYARKHGPDATDGSLPRVGGGGRHDTLCYATQVNQDALGRALAEPLDASFVIGGKNSSNTYQLQRLCAQRLGDQAFFIQSEANIRSLDEIEHYVFPAEGAAPGGSVTLNALTARPAEGAPLRILVTGGASCPDGLIQQVIFRINSLLGPENLRPVETVLADLTDAD